jgi:hypothetical protein
MKILKEEEINLAWKTLYEREYKKKSIKNAKERYFEELIKNLIKKQIENKIYNDDYITNIINKFGKYVKIFSINQIMIENLKIVQIFFY